MGKLRPGGTYLGGVGDEEQPWGMGLIPEEATLSPTGKLCISI